MLARADRESASSTRQSVQAAGARLPTLLPEELSASFDVGLTQGAMMGDQSLCKRRTVNRELFLPAKRFLSQAATA
jgi:hypothetical protein